MVRQNLGDRFLRREIFDGTYEPGQQIFEAELAKMLKLSRGPLEVADVVRHNVGTARRNCQLQDVIVVCIRELRAPQRMDPAALAPGAQSVKHIIDRTL